MKGEGCSIDIEGGGENDLRRRENREEEEVKEEEEEGCGFSLSPSSSLPSIKWSRRRRKAAPQDVHDSPQKI